MTVAGARENNDIAVRVTARPVD